MSASTDLERRLVRVRDPQLLAFECIALLLSVLRVRLASTPSHGEAWHVLMPLFDAATDAVAEPLTTRAEHCADVRYQADRLASRYWSRVDAEGRWSLECQIPYDIATSIRRACEPDVGRMLPLIVRDARNLLHHAMAGPERIDALVAAALAPTPTTEGDTTCRP